jgi:hypothetical protein
LATAVRHHHDISPPPILLAQVTGYHHTPEKLLDSLDQCPLHWSKHVSFIPFSFHCRGTFLTILRSCRVPPESFRPPPLVMIAAPPQRPPVSHLFCRCDLSVSCGPRDLDRPTHDRLAILSVESLTALSQLWLITGGAIGPGPVGGRPRRAGRARFWPGHCESGRGPALSPVRRGRFKIPFQFQK